MAQPGFVMIRIGDAAYEVPGEGTLLHAFQYLRMREVMAAGFCWNGECVTCEVELEAETGYQAFLACQLPITEGMRVVDVSATLRHCLRGLSAPAGSCSEP